jgi:DDE family transposase
LTPLSCHRVRAIEVRLLLGVLADNLGSLSRRLVLALAIQSWSLSSLRPRPFKTGKRLIQRARYFVLQLAESHLTGYFLGQILGRIEKQGVNIPLPTGIWQRIGGHGAAPRGRASRFDGTSPPSLSG